MNTTTFSTARHPVAACMLAATVTLVMLLGVNGLAAQGAAEAQMAAAATLMVAAPKAASGV